MSRTKGNKAKRKPVVKPIKLTVEDRIAQFTRVGSDPGPIEVYRSILGLGRPVEGIPLSDLVAMKTVRDRAEQALFDYLSTSTSTLTFPGCGSFRWARSLMSWMLCRETRPFT
jgi:hypothetical protein